MVDHLMILSLWCYGLIGQLSPDVIGRLPVLKAKVFLAVKLEWRVSICRCYYDICTPTDSQILRFVQSFYILIC